MVKRKRARTASKKKDTLKWSEWFNIHWPDPCSLGQKVKEFIDTMEKRGRTPAQIWEAAKKINYGEYIEEFLGFIDENTDDNDTSALEELRRLEWTARHSDKFSKALSDEINRLERSPSIKDLPCPRLLKDGSAILDRPKRKRAA